MNKTYKILNSQFFSYNEYSIVPIRYEDRIDIMNWRNQQIYHLRQNKPLTIQDQNNYFDNVVSKLFDEEKPSQILFSFLENEKCVGYGGVVHINWIDRNAEISFIIDTALENQYFEKYWGIYLKLIEKVAFVELNLHKIYTYAYDIRPHLYKAIEGVGYLKEAILKEHCLFNGKYLDVIIHSKQNSCELFLKPVDINDVKLLFEWANDKTVRENAFETSKIIWEDHVKWLKKKIESQNSKMFILINNQNECLGQIRADLINNFWEIDYSIDEEHRGNGYGKKIIEYLYTELPKDSIIKAIVKNQNISSLKVFVNLGFDITSDENKNISIFYKKIK